MGLNVTYCVLQKREFIKSYRDPERLEHKDSDIPNDAVS